MAKYRKKPVVIEAILFVDRDSYSEAKEFVGKALKYDYQEPDMPFIETLEGNMAISKGDYIIKGVQGEFYPCKPDIFEQTYELVL